MPINTHAQNISFTYIDGNGIDYPETVNVSVIETDSGAEFWEKKTHKLYRVACPILWTMGFVTNSICTYMFGHSSMLPVCLPFLILSIVQNGALLFGLLKPYLSTFDIIIRDNSPFVCRAYSIIRSTLRMFPIWIVCYVNVRRFISTIQRTKLLFFNRQTFIELFLILLAIVILNSHQLMLGYQKTSGDGTTYFVCGVDFKSLPNYTHFLKHIWYWLDLTMALLLPSTVILLTGFATNFIFFSSRKNLQENNVRLRKHVLMMTHLSVSISYIVFMAPNSILSAVYFIFNERWFRSYATQKEFFFYIAVTNIFVHIRFCIDLFIFYGTWSKFRELFKETFRRIQKIIPSY
ncbi:hypothetical protein SNEBB_005106 [Seison nebaliae]|nr:hypothetical protein SNEBB_005106 [Seison nebaliae]